MSQVKRNTQAKDLFDGGLPIRLHMRNDLHLARKAWHMIMGLLIVCIYVFSGMSNSTGAMILGSALGIAIIMETARLRAPAINEKVMRVWGPFMRSSEVNRISGVPYYLLAAMLAVAIFPRPIAVLSLLYLAVGDPIASLFGILYGDRSIRFRNGKSLIGTLAGIVACALVTFFFIKTYPLAVSDSVAALIILIGALTGGTAEMVPVDMDDNFTIPMVSGFVLWLTFIAAGV